MSTDKEQKLALDNIIARSSVVIDQVLYSDGEIYFPSLYRYIVDEETGKLIQCPND